MSSIAWYPAYLFTIITNSIAFSLGLILSLGVPCFFVDRVNNVSSANHRVALSEQQTGPSTTDQCSWSFWNYAFITQLYCSFVGYCVNVYIFWLDLPWFITAIVQTTITIFCVNVGIAMTAATTILFVNYLEDKSWS